jgi:hypothetical protein
MSIFKEEWSEERKSSFDDVELHSPKGPDDAGNRGGPVPYKRRSAGLWTALVALAALVGALAAYGYWAVSSQNGQLAWLPGLSKSISSMRERTGALESSLKEWSSKQEKLSAALRKLNAGFESGLRSVRQHADKLVADASRKEHAELDQRTAVLNAQIAEVASRQRTNQTHLARLDKEMAGQRQALASIKDSSGQQMEALQQQQVSTQGEIASINNLLSTDEVDFEAEKNQDTEIVSGVSLHLTGTDISHQRYAGWVWLAGSRRRIWVHAQTVETPLVFYPEAGGEAYEMVVTRVNPKEVAGYMLVPSDAKAHGTDVASNRKPITRPGPDGF